MTNFVACEEVFPVLFCFFSFLFIFSNISDISATTLSCIKSNHFKVFDTITVHLACLSYFVEWYC